MVKLNKLMAAAMVFAATTFGGLPQGLENRIGNVGVSDAQAIEYDASLTMEEFGNDWIHYALKNISNNNNDITNLYLNFKGERDDILNLGGPIVMTEDKDWSGYVTPDPRHPGEISASFDGRSDPILPGETFNFYLPVTNNPNNFLRQECEFYTFGDGGTQFQNYNGFYDISGNSPTPVPTPESGTLLFFGLGLLGASVAYQRKKENEKNASKVQFPN